jgi:alkylation response protein AidB-like acyl-CoA dehydrogenase
MIPGQDSGAHHVPLPEADDWYTPDEHLRWLVRRSVGEAVWSAAQARLEDAGRLVPQDVEPRVRLADAHPPILHQYAANGARIDDIEFHPAYRELERLEHGFGLVRMSYMPGWSGLHACAPRTLAAAFVYLFTQADQALCGCPVMMTDAMCWALQRNDPQLASRFLPRLASDGDDYASGAMFMTEKAGGSDVGAAETRALRQDDGTWRLVGDKWFCSNAGADLVLVLARPEGAGAGTRGLGLFLMPRMLDDGNRNHYLIKRLKEKYGTRMMASAEIRLEGAFAWQVGRLDQGFKQMLDMVNLTRVMIPTATAGAMRRGAFEALHYASRRRTFGARLDSHALMRDTLAELVVDQTAGLTAAMAAAEAFDRTAAGESGAAGVLRLLTPLLKLHGTERARTTAADAMEARGGNGYIMDWPDGRILRDVSVHAIWEGPPNIIALDVLRALSQGAGADLFGELEHRAESAATGLTAPLARALLAEQRRQRKRLERMREVEEEERLLGARRVSRDLGQLAVATYLTEQAGQFAEDAGSGRLAWLAARYAARLAGEHAVANVATDPAWLPHADALLNGGAVPLELGGRAVEAVAAALGEPWSMRSA